jgi:NADH-ubiquinone oxidoreductase chain 2
VGTVVGLVQSRIKRLFAYSTISHVGFILLALAINSIESIQAFIFYIIQYLLSNLNFFFLLISLGYFLSYNNEKKIKLLDEKYSPLQLIHQLKGFFFENQILSLCLAITLFSFAGIPLLIGFFGEQMVLSAALVKYYILMALIAIITKSNELLSIANILAFIIFKPYE